MSERTYSAKLRSHEYKITNRELAVYRDRFIEESELAKRMSELMWFKMYILLEEFGISPYDILSAIKDLEQGEPGAGVKPATQFKKMPLRGLWHKHFFSARFLVNNMRLGLGKNGIGKLVDEVMDSAKSPIITREMIGELIHRLTHGTIEARSADKKLTGEWIIYLPHGEKNYYLTVASHGTGDQAIYDQIFSHCLRDFPHLAAWLKAAQAE